MPELHIKGWMIDAARLPEPLPYYRRLIDFCSAWGFNTILFRLADDQGSACRFTSHPELVTHPNAFTTSELAELAAFAAQRGVDLIPEVESFGHTGFITRSPAHAHLLDSQLGVNTFTGVIPTHPQTLAILADLYREVASIFPSRYLHGGCDEVNWGGSDYSRAAIDRRGRAAVWTEHLNALNTLSRSLGKELMIWADHVLAGPESELLLQGLAREVILVDWNYWESEPARRSGWDEAPGPIQARASRALAAGFRLVGAPAWGWCRWGVRAGESQLQNIAAFADVYRAAPDPNCLGVIVTNWVPSRFLQGATWDAPAFAAVSLSEGSAAARLAAFPRFVADHYSAAWDAAWADVFQTIYSITPPRRGCAAEWRAPFQPPVWAAEGELSALAHATPASLASGKQFARDLPFARLKGQLAACAGQVRRNLADFQAFTLAVEYLEHLHWRCAVVQEVGGPDQAAELIQIIAARDAQVLEALEKEWDCGRFRDAPAKTGLLADLRMEDQTLLGMRIASEFGAELAEQPGKFYELIR